MPEFTFVLPDLGEGLIRAEVATWKVAEGDSVVVNQPIVEVHTDKALVEIPSPVEGTVTTLHANDGDEVDVGKPLITFEVAHKAVLVGYGVSNATDTTKKVSGLAPPPPRKRAIERGGVGRETPLAVEPGVVEPAASHAVAPGEPELSNAVAPGESVAVRGIRKTIAKRMAESWASIPHVTTYLTLDATELETRRARLEISPLALIVKAWSKIVVAHPLLNAHFNNDKIVLHSQCNIGIAAATKEGLVVVVVKDVEALSPTEISEIITQLAQQARDGSIKVADMRGATTTISNVGVFGAEYGTPIINPGESSILATGVIEPRAVVKAGEIVARDCMTLSLSFDHRAIDGADAGEALAELREILEDPDALIELG